MSKSSRFSIVPARLYWDKRITHKTDLLVIGALGTFSDTNGWCWPSRSTLGDMIGVNKTNITKSINRLIEYGYLIKSPRLREDGSSTSNKYKILMDNELDDSNTRNNNTPQGVSPNPPQGVSPNPPLNDSIMNDSPSSYEEQKEEVNFLFMKENWKPLPRTIVKIKQKNRCSDNALQVAIKEFIKFYITTKQEKLDWDKALENWCDFRKSWKEDKPETAFNNNLRVDELLSNTGGEERIIMENLLKEFGSAIFISWISHLKLIESNIDCLRFKVKNNFIKEWIEINYLKNISAVINAFKPEINKVEVIC